jgi:hypothetical protein
MKKLFLVLAVVSVSMDGYWLCYAYFHQDLKK